MSTRGFEGITLLAVRFAFEVLGSESPGFVPGSGSKPPPDKSLRTSAEAGRWSFVEDGGRSLVAVWLVAEAGG